MHKHSNLLGMLGLTPFLALPFYILTGSISQFEALGYYTTYSAIILSFLGGVHWYDAQVRTQSTEQLYVAMLPSIVGWLSISLFDSTVTLSVLASSFVLLLMYDFQRLDMSAHYRQLRSTLTGVVTGSHLAMIWLIH